MVNANHLRSGALSLAGLILLAGPLADSVARADSRSDVGLPQLLLYFPGLDGTGVNVAQPEASSFVNQVNQNDFEVNPTTVGTTIPISYVNSIGATASTFPNGVGTESSHGDFVAGVFYGPTGGIAPSLASVTNYDADYFVSSIVFTNTPTTAKVINQSFVLTVDTVAEGQMVEQSYDNYVVLQNVIICSAAGNGGIDAPFVQLPASAYNVIAVGAYGASSSTGPVEGRAKPDITAIQGFTSFSTPIVSGVASILVQGGTQGHGGAGTQSAAVDARTVKALLLNGAEKTYDWANAPPSVPLDLRYGAGLVNVNRSFRNLTGGMHPPTATNSVALDAAHPPVSAGTNVGPVGWNLRANIMTTATTDVIDHYLIDLTHGGNAFVFTATLTWDRPYNPQISSINNLDLFFYNTVSGTPIAASTSSVDNVEHIYMPSLGPGVYDLEVLKHGGAAGNANWVSDTDTYAVTWMASLLGDTDLNGKVDFNDFLTLTYHYGQPGTWQSGDYNNNGTVNFSDFLLLSGNFDKVIGSASLPPQTVPLARLSAASAPEPAAGLTLLLGLAAFRPRRRRR